MAVIRCGTTAEIIKTEKVSLQEKRHLIQILTLISMNIFTSVRKCLRKNPRKQGTEEEVQMHHV